MEKLRNYHPIFTENYRWEFLSNLSGQAIQDFLQVDTATSARFAIKAMQDIMANVGLIWGVTPKNSEKLIGIIKLSAISDEHMTIKLQFSDKVPEEILSRLAYFVKHQLHIPNSQIAENSDAAAQLKNFLK
ncbi:hypothetical protein [Bombilactobacillus bombi]|uniref:hypothetical protein n=1 Tax=Bombilactobacillus bombi TaxID=1303590 RepID=UPI0015E5D03A|nr:hypothetical protein [Bombilactobacillus bombi]MBA1434096.1 hypothetical protein [Bombilactobacillus bombi]